MQGHWSELVDSLCDLRGSSLEEFSDIERAVDVARSYLRDLRFPTLMQELKDATLDVAAHEAEAHRTEQTVDYLNFPTVLALTFTAHALIYGEGEEGATVLDIDEFDSSCRRVGCFILIEKMRRMGAYKTLRLPHNPWDDETPVECEDKDPEKMADFLRWLGYTPEEN